MIIAIRGWPTRLKSRRAVEGPCMVYVAVSCSVIICLMLTLICLATGLGGEDIVSIQGVQFLIVQPGP